MKNKKTMIIGLVVLLLVGGGIFFLKKDKTSDTPATTQKKKLSLPTNVIPVSERPYLTLLPSADGRYITIGIENLKKEAGEMSYEIEYQTGSMLQGFQGLLSLDKLPSSEKKLFGSQSAGGAITYHEDIKGGSLLTRYTEGSEPYALKSDWKYIENTKRETAFSSKDAKFQIDGKTLAQQRYLIIFNTPGYPEGVPGEVASEVYSLTSSGSLTGEAELTIRSNEEGELKIAAWDGEEWMTYEGEVDDKMITATVDLVELYVVVK
ncbi:MAG: hypothetical protein HN981_04865 [Candidatus Pacebacteria bacterium]|jgi:hypothetical protein|nr:hypothetical protein [Candidatus Paceibacterota bacterium]MBT4652080.1 hypothetical protein [Candidatus Paceibacterota bacterium]MBT6756102.1 hypothetical protein [Candidatus Paceibacterota bacterium]MBT6921695.1 hypothetical protein [Candidatus Paceibacterota bacterium]